MLKNNVALWVGLFGGALLWGACAPSFLSRTPQAIYSQECPREDLGESAQDCPWAGWVREFERSQSGSMDLPPAIAESIRRDAADLALRDAWGLSQNYEESAQAEIVQPSILGLLAQRFGVGVERRKGRAIVHAGLIHTYGYLLSNLRTPYGFKRARWVSGRMEQGLSLPAQTLGPNANELTESTSLLAQVTYLLLRVALHDRPEAWREWSHRLDARVTPELRSLQLPPIERIRETQRLASGETVDWVTDLVSLPGDPRGGRLLVYSQRSSVGTRLITGFPVERGFSQRRNHPVKPRYNAWVD